MKRDDAMDAPNSRAVYLATRHYSVLWMLIALLAALVLRALYLQLVEQDFLTSQGVQRQIRLGRRVLHAADADDATHVRILPGWSP